MKMLYNAVKQYIKKFPSIKGIIQQRNQLHQETVRLSKELSELRQAVGAFPPGHFYSPLPSIEEIEKDASLIWKQLPRTIDGIDLNEEAQLQLFEQFKEYYQSLPFQPMKTQNLRYYFENPMYSYSDAICLYSMIRYAKPKTIIEVGSGYSSCVILDTNEFFFEGKIQTLFIEPFPKLLLSLIKACDKDRIHLLPKRLQDVEVEVFTALQVNDILFIDSTHVSKVNSDVNYIFSKILPCLNRGVYIHFHDIFYPFEYPKDFVYKFRYWWNEAYVLRAFLQYNESFKIIFFNTFLEYFYEERFRKDLPLCLENPGGSIWLQKQ